jgi:hypothetical protein
MTRAHASLGARPRCLDLGQVVIAHRQIATSGSCSIMPSRGECVLDTGPRIPAG